jgi:hypothetical protein
MKTGLKINQICIGNAFRKGKKKINPSEIVLTGKISTFRYFHSFKDQQYNELDSTRGETSDLSSDNNDKAVKTVNISENDPDVPSSSFATLKMWFDSWKVIIFIYYMALIILI